MKATLLLGALALLSGFGSQAQTTLNGNHIITGSLSVGSPPANTTYQPGQLHLAGTAFFDSNLIFNNGWVFDNNPSGTLYLVKSFDYTKALTFQNDGSVTFPQRVGIGDVSCPTGTTCTGTLGLNNMTLAVGGKIGARGGVYVVNYGGQWPDYVFSPSYRLRPLAEVAQFIAANHHLPDVPSAAQVQTEGLELTAMNAVLLQKVEELTLHLIELAKANQALTARVAQLEVAK